MRYYNCKCYLEQQVNTRWKFTQAWNLEELSQLYTILTGAMSNFSTATYGGLPLKLSKQVKNQLRLRTVSYSSHILLQKLVDYDWCQEVIEKGALQFSDYVNWQVAVKEQKQLAIKQLISRRIFPFLKPLDTLDAKNLVSKKQLVKQGEYYLYLAALGYRSKAEDVRLSTHIHCLDSYLIRPIDFCRTFYEDIVELNELYPKSRLIFSFN